MSRVSTNQAELFAIIIRKGKKREKNESQRGGDITKGRFMHLLTSGGSKRSKRSILLFSLVSHVILYYYHLHFLDSLVNPKLKRKQTNNNIIYGRH